MNQYTVYECISFFAFTAITNMIQPVLELGFWGRFSGRKVEARHYAMYIFLSFVVSAVEQGLQSLPLSLVFSTVRTAMLWGLGAAFLKCPAAVSLLSAIITKIVTFLSAGITASLTFLTAPAVFSTAIGEKAAGGILFGLLGQVFTIGLIFVSYRLILYKFRWQGALPYQYLTVFFLPVLMVLFVEQYIFNQVYGNEIIIKGAEIIKPAANHWQIFFIQLFACLSLFSVLYACRRLTEDVSGRTRLLLLERESAAQRGYLEESRTRYEQTRSFRHDIRNHFQTLAGLLEQGEAVKAKEYLGKLEIISEMLSFPCNTGNTVVDTVLGSKLGVARQNGIQVECTVRLPSPCPVDDLDLCILFSNAVDNAIHACKELGQGRRFIRISGRGKGEFFMLEFENSCKAGGTFGKGIGLNNIEAVSEKYHGAVTAKMQEGCFYLNVLLVLNGASING